MSKYEAPKLGAPVAGYRMERRDVPTQRFGYGGRGWDQVYKPTDDYVSGIFIGVRSVSDGYTTHSEDDGFVWHPYAWHRVALVAFSPHRQPAMVLLSEMDWL
jgi:hypothetical protein